MEFIPWVLYYGGLMGALAVANQVASALGLWDSAVAKRINVVLLVAVLGPLALIGLYIWTMPDKKDPDEEPSVDVKQPEYKAKTHTEAGEAAAVTDHRIDNPGDPGEALDDLIEYSNDELEND